MLLPIHIPWCIQSPQGAITKYHTGWLKQNNYFYTGLEAGKSRIKSGNIKFLQYKFSLPGWQMDFCCCCCCVFYCFFLFFFFLFTWLFLSSCTYCTMMAPLSWSHLTQIVNTSPKPHMQTSHWGTGFQHTNLRGYNIQSLTRTPWNFKADTVLMTEIMCYKLQ